jgi:hypothetical protein
VTEALIAIGRSIKTNPTGHVDNLRLTPAARPGNNGSGLMKFFGFSFMMRIELLDHDRRHLIWPFMAALANSPEAVAGHFRVLGGEAFRALTRNW